MEFKDYVDSFKETIKNKVFKEDLKKVKLMKDTDENIVQSVCEHAIYLGYLDACRTFNGQKKLKEKGDTRIKNLAGKMQKYLQKEDEEFKHDEYCSDLIEKNLMSYGQAQKIVNMAFKYLYLLEKDSDVEEKFKVCHMPLDGIMLEWIKRNEKIDINKIDSWSKMNGEDYKKYQKAISNYIKKYCTEDNTPLKLDFENWETMSMILATEEYYSKIIKSIKEIDKTLIKEKSKELLDGSRKNCAKILRGE